MAVFSAVLVLSVLADRITKNIVLANIDIGNSIDVIPGILNFTYVENTGAAWGIFGGKTSALIVGTVILMLALLVYYFINRKKASFLDSLSIALIVGGGAGNLIDRISQAYVVDFIDIQIIPVFNVADICITCGAILLVLDAFFGEYLKTKSNE